MQQSRWKPTILWSSQRRYCVCLIRQKQCSATYKILLAWALDLSASKSTLVKVQDRWQDLTLFCMLMLLFSHNMTGITTIYRTSREEVLMQITNKKAFILCFIKSSTVPFFLALSLAFLPGKETKRLDSWHVTMTLLSEDTLIPLTIWQMPACK